MYLLECRVIIKDNNEWIDSGRKFDSIEKAEYEMNYLNKLQDSRRLEYRVQELKEE